MTKPATNRQIETASRELNRTISAVVEAWRQHEPYPTWEQEEEWQEANPSPRKKHARLQREVEEVWKQKANALLLQIKMGEISSEDCYAHLKALMDHMYEARLSYLRTS